MKKNEVFNTRANGNVENAPKLFNTLKEALAEMYSDIYYLTEKEKEDKEFFIIENEYSITIIDKEKLNKYLNDMDINDMDIMK